MENNHQLQFNFDLGEIEEQGDKLKTHPYNTEITLNELKEKILNINDRNSLYYDKGLDFLLYPIISDNKNLIQENILKEIYKDPNFIIENREEIESKQVKSDILFNFTGEITKTLEEQTLDTNFRYFINYYFVSPLETAEEKREYILNLKEIELPKKYIYDIFNNLEKEEPLNFTDKELLGLGYSEAEYWSLTIKPRLEKYFNNSGLHKIKNLYDNLTPMERIKEPTKEAKEKYKEFYFIDKFLLDASRQELYLTTPKIKDYESELNYKIDVISKAIEKAEATYKELDESFKAKVREYRGIFESQIEEYITNQYNSSHEIKKDFKELNRYYSNLYNFSFYNSIKEDDERYKETKEDIEYINQLKNSKEPRERLYYLILEKETYYNNYVWINKTRIVYLKKTLNELKKEGTLENYCNKLLKELLDKKYHRLDLIKAEEKIEQERGKIATYVNEVLNSLHTANVSFKDADITSIEKYNSISSKIKELKEKIANLEKEEKSFTISYDELEELKSQKASLLEELENYKKELKALNIVEFIKKDEKGEIKKTYSRGIISSSKTNNIDFEDEPSHIVINYGYFEIIRPKSLIVKTMKNKKTFYKTYYLDEFTPKLTTSLAVLTELIITKASLPKEQVSKLKVISFDLQDLVNKVNPKATFKDQVSELRLMLQLLRDQSIQRIIINDPVKKKNYTYANLSFISDYVLDTGNNKLEITLGEIISTVIGANNYSKIRTYKDLSFDSPEEAIISSHIDNMLNQSQEGERTLKASSLIAPVPTYKALIFDKKHFVRNITQPFIKNLNNLRTNPYVNYDINKAQLEELETAKTYEMLENLSLHFKYKEGETPQKFINRAEANQEKELKKKDKLRRLEIKNKK